MFRQPGASDSIPFTVVCRDAEPPPQDQPLGVDVCLSCFNGGCLDRDRAHMRLHVLKSGHTFTLNVKRKMKPSSNRVRVSPILVLVHR